MISSRPLARSQLVAASNNAAATTEIVHALEESEAADVRFVKGIIVWIVARHDSADDFPVRAREKKCGVAVLEKGMFLLVEKFLSFEEKRRHPGVIVP